MVSNFITRASFFPFVHSPTAANLDSVSVGLAMISASFLGYYKQQWLSTVPCVDSKLQISDNCKILYTYLQSLFSSPRWSDSSTNHNESRGISGAKPKAPSPEALIFLTYLSCAVLGENKAVHMSHGHHIKNRAPGVAQRTRDQCSEVMSQEIQVILRRGSVSLERHRKLQETHQKTTLPSVAESKQWGLPQLLRHCCHITQYISVAQSPFGAGPLLPTLTDVTCLWQSVLKISSVLWISVLPVKWQYLLFGTGRKRYFQVKRQSAFSSTISSVNISEGLTTAYAFSKKRKADIYARVNAAVKLSFEK